MESVSFVRDCWKLVETYEENKTSGNAHGKLHLRSDGVMVENMVQHGVMGRIVHCEGGYRHDLRDEDAHWKRKPPLPPEKLSQQKL